MYFGEASELLLKRRRMYIKGPVLGAPAGVKWRQQGVRSEVGRLSGGSGS